LTVDEIFGTQWRTLSSTYGLRRVRYLFVLRLGTVSHSIRMSARAHVRGPTDSENSNPHDASTPVSRLRTGSWQLLAPELWLSKLNYLCNARRLGTFQLVLDVNDSHQVARPVMDGKYIGLYIMMSNVDLLAERQRTCRKAGATPIYCTSFSQHRV
jgi:hypothetical protein